MPKLRLSLLRLRPESAPMVCDMLCVRTKRRIGRQTKACSIQSCVLAAGQSIVGTRRLRPPAIAAAASRSRRVRLERRDRDLHRRPVVIVYARQALVAPAILTGLGRRAQQPAGDHLRARIDGAEVSAVPAGSRGRHGGIVASDRLRLCPDPRQCSLLALRGNSMRRPAALILTMTPGIGPAGARCRAVTLWRRLGPWQRTASTIGFETLHSACEASAQR